MEVDSAKRFHSVANVRSASSDLLSAEVIVLKFSVVVSNSSQKDKLQDCEVNQQIYMARNSIDENFYFIL